MESHYTFSDEDFKNKFESLTLNPEWFTHEAHLRLAWIYLMEKELFEAEEALCSSIQRFDNKFGDGSVYHKTVSIAAVRIIHRIIQDTKASSFQKLLEITPSLQADFKSLIKVHYSFDVFSDLSAKKSFIEPDRLPF